MEAPSIAEITSQLCWFESAIDFRLRTFASRLSPPTFALRLYHVRREWFPHRAARHERLIQVARLSGRLRSSCLGPIACESTVANASRSPPTERRYFATLVHRRLHLHRHGSGEENVALRSAPFACIKYAFRIGVPHRPGPRHECPRFHGASFRPTAPRRMQVDGFPVFVGSAHEAALSSSSSRLEQGSLRNQRLNWCLAIAA